MAILFPNTLKLRISKTDGDRFRDRPWLLDKVWRAFRKPPSAMISSRPSAFYFKKCKNEWSVFQLFFYYPLKQYVPTDIFSSSIDFTHVADSLVHGRTVSVRPSFKQTSNGKFFSNNCKIYAYTLVICSNISENIHDINIYSAYSKQSCHRSLVC